jgi:hypothetical protein
MRDFIESIATDRSWYAALILLDTPGWIGYSMHVTLPSSVTDSPVYLAAGWTIIALNAVVMLAYLAYGLISLVEFLRER